MVSEATDGSADTTTEPVDLGDADEGTGSTLVNRWIALDRGWQALALGLAVVVAHVGVELLAQTARLVAGQL
ncbi:MAG: hypothetical protein PPP55_08770 [Halorubrum sp.]